MADGLTATLGLISGLIISHQSPHAVWHAALSLGVAEFAGMGWGYYEEHQGRWFGAALCGIAACLAIVLPAVPYVFSTGPGALADALVAVLALATVVAFWRSQPGVQAALRTYGLLVAACGLVVFANVV